MEIVVDEVIHDIVGGNGPQFTMSTYLRRSPHY